MNKTKNSTAPLSLLNAKVYVGCAGWSLSGDASALFPAGDSHLGRYAARLPAVEINTSFYRPHRPTTYRRWAESVPEDFRFSVKIPKVITHERRLAIESSELQSFIDEVSALEDRLRCLLVQLPPTLRFDRELATRFFTMIRKQSSAAIVCEPRHVSWFEPDANSVLESCGIAQVAADPAVVPAAAVPGGSLNLIYYRWHGSPRMYYSAYDDAHLSRLTNSFRTAQAEGRECWCIFDNTASGAAIQNALALLQSGPVQ
ncbi:MAG: hypothetical protein JWN70_5911 [Planctomycetaceae bacterium]|nr:hypothetical protein [Planctomycetaceae bacterium]